MDISQTTTFNGQQFQTLVIGGANKLKENLKIVNDLNVFPIPDGDTGDNMYRTLSGGVQTMLAEQGSSVEKKAKALADGMLLNARGNSGVILSQIFSGIAKGFEGVETATIPDVSTAFNEGVKKGYSAVVIPVEGTILTVAREASERFAENAKVYSSAAEAIDDLIKSIKISLENTPELLAVLKEAGVVDSGGAGLMYVAEGVKEAMLGDTAHEEAATASVPGGYQQPDLTKFTENDVMEFAYCTEFMLRLQTSKVDVEKFDVNEVIDYLSTIGDSIVAFKTGTIVKVHVHTITPYKALEYCHKFGEFLTVKIENMTLQHNETIAKKAETAKSDESILKVKRARRKFGLCAVASGDGVVELFKELGADEVVNGGQSNNPSINEFIEAFDRINADNVFVLPNNPNIFLAAKQAAEMYNSSKVYVIPSKDVGQAYSALSMLDYSPDDADAIAENLVSDMADVTTCSVTRAVRDTSLNGVDIKTDDYIGLSDKTIYVSMPDKLDAFKGLTDKVGLKDKSFLTVICGKDATDEEKTAAESFIAENYKDVEAYFIDGGQEYYDFILIME